MSSGISAAYSSRAAEYTSLFGSISSTHTDDHWFPVGLTVFPERF